MEWYAIPWGLTPKVRFMEIRFNTRNIEQTVSFAGQELCRYLQQMLRDEEEQIEMGCQYCDAKYYFTKKDLDRMIKTLKNK